MEQERRRQLQGQVSKGAECRKLLAHPILQDFYRDFQEALKRKVWDTPLDDKERFIKGVMDIKEQAEGLKMFMQHLEQEAETGQIAQSELSSDTE